eukprot:487045_1
MAHRFVSMLVIIGVLFDNASSKCVIGSKCKTRADCCTDMMDTKFTGVTCASLGKSGKVCCVTNGGVGCRRDDNCCGKNSICQSGGVCRSTPFLINSINGGNALTNERDKDSATTLKSVDSKGNLPFLLIALSVMCCLGLCVGTLCYFFIIGVKKETYDANGGGTLTSIHEYKSEKSELQLNDIDDYESDEGIPMAPI